MYCCCKGTGRCSGPNTINPDSGRTRRKVATSSKLGKVADNLEGVGEGVGGGEKREREKREGEAKGGERGGREEEKRRERREREERGKREREEREKKRKQRKQR